jgi:mutator protein MutT
MTVMENKRTPFTLCLIHDNDRILLGMKKQGLGTGRWNGFGGKVEPGETIEEATKREILEEAGMKVEHVVKMGEMDFEFAAKPGDILEVHIYRGEKWSGTPRECDEMRPEWWKVSEIPFNMMWPDDRYWLPLFLDNKKFRGRFLFGPNDSVLEFSLRVVG